MSRPWLLVFLLLLIVFTSQFEWKQQLVTELEESLDISQKQQYVSNREETVKEQIILSQEKKIHQLNELVRSLREQLQQCSGEHEPANGYATPLTQLLSELGRQQILGG